MDNSDFSQNAIKIAECHNDRELWVKENVNPNYVDHIEFTGKIEEGITKNELLPNLKNPALMDNCEVTYFSAEFSCQYRPSNGKRIKKSIRSYYVGQKISRIEIGSHYDNR